MKARFQLAAIFRDHLAALLGERALSPREKKVSRAILRCRTPELGGTVYLCAGCGDVAPVYRSCRDRHCPQCQSLDSARWERERRERGLPTSYFHVVATTPGRIGWLFELNPSLLYGDLLSVAGRTVVSLAEERLGDLPGGEGARAGASAVLHTWNREAKRHYHVHLLVPAGGVTPDGRWLERKRDSLLPKDVLATRWRDALLGELRRLLARGELFLGDRTREEVERELDRLSTIRWIAYAKRTLRGGDEALAYLARYACKVALSNERLLSYDGEIVVLATKHGRSVTLTGLELVKRFLQHVLPKGLVRIRHYGILSSRNVPTLLARARAALERSGARVETPPDAKLGWADLMKDLTGVDVRKCSCCGAARSAHVLHPGETVDRVLARVFASAPVVALALPRPAT